jgi:hypothetical protein
MSAARAEANAPEPTMGSYEDLTYKVLPREYGDANNDSLLAFYSKRVFFSERSKQRYIAEKKTDIDNFSSESSGITRNIIVQTIPKGTLLYHYYYHPSYEPSSRLSPTFIRKQQTIRYFSRFAFQEINYNFENDTVTFCLSKAMIDPHYYFGVPFAAEGLSKKEDKIYNTMIPVVLKEDIHLAYLKSGAAIPDTSTMHKLDPNPYFNFQRVSSCKYNDIISQNGTPCDKTGETADACLRTPFAAEQELDGNVALSWNDSLLMYDTRKNTYIVPDTNAKFYEKMLQYRNKCIDATPDTKENETNIYATILLALSQDNQETSEHVPRSVDHLPYSREAVGFSEYALHPYGKKGYRGEHFLPPPVDGLYTIDEFIEGDKQIITTSFSNFERVYKQFIEPNLIVKPLGIVSSVMKTQDAIISPEAVMSDEYVDFWAYRRIPNGNMSSNTVKHQLFFDWLLANKYTFLYNPFLNTFGLYKVDYPYSYLSMFRYTNNFEENPDLPDKGHATRAFTNVALRQLIHVLTYTKPDGSYALNTSEIQCALEMKYLKSVLWQDKRHQNGVYFYSPISNGGQPRPIFVGPMHDVDFIRYKTKFKELTTELPFSFGLQIDDDFLNYLDTNNRENKFIYIGRIVPPSANNLQNQAVLNNTNLSKTNTALFNGGSKKRRLHGRNYKTYKRILKKGRGKAKRGTRRTK